MNYAIFFNYNQALTWSKIHLFSYLLRDNNLEFARLFHNWHRSFLYKTNTASIISFPCEAPYWRWPQLNLPRIFRGHKVNNNSIRDAHIANEATMTLKAIYLGINPRFSPVEEFFTILNLLGIIKILSGLLQLKTARFLKEDSLFSFYLYFAIFFPFLRSSSNLIKYHCCCHSDSNFLEVGSLER